MNKLVLVGMLLIALTTIGTAEHITEECTTQTSETTRCETQGEQTICYMQAVSLEACEIKIEL